MDWDTFFLPPPMPFYQPPSLLPAFSVPFTNDSSGTASVTSPVMGGWDLGIHLPPGTYNILPALLLDTSPGGYGAAAWDGARQYSIAELEAGFRQNYSVAGTQLGQNILPDIIQMEFTPATSPHCPAPVEPPIFLSDTPCNTISSTTESPPEGEKRIRRPTDLTRRFYARLKARSAIKPVVATEHTTRAAPSSAESEPKSEDHRQRRKDKGHSNKSSVDDGREERSKLQEAVIPERPKKTRYGCDTCKRTFVRVYDLIRHQEVHETQTYYFCDLCNGMYTRKDSVTRHRQKCAYSKNKKEADEF